MSSLWYLARGTGLSCLVLLTAVVVLGVLQVNRWAPGRWPRFVSQGLHRNLSLMVLVLLFVHVVSAELDPFAPLGWLAVVVPFLSSYRPIWLGLGTVASDLFLAMLVSSLLRNRIGYRAWKFLHWAAYACWPGAVVHGLGTGTDTRIEWVEWLTVACVAAVLAAGSMRLAIGWPAGRTKRLTAAFTAGVSVIAVTAWVQSGPMRPGWARRAGTPSSLLGPRAPLESSTGPSGAREGRALPGTSARGKGPVILALSRRHHTGAPYVPASGGAAVANGPPPVSNQARGPRAENE